jgi:hypothetical protein
MRAVSSTLAALVLAATMVNQGIAWPYEPAYLDPSVKPGPGNRVWVPPVTSHDNPWLRAVVVYDHLIPFQCGTTRGYLQDRVVKSTYPGFDKLQFYSRIREVSGPGIRLLGRFYFPKRVGVGYRTDGLGSVGPQYAFRADDRDYLVIFDFAGSSISGSCVSGSYFILLASSANHYDIGGWTTLTNTEGKAVVLRTARPIY